MRIALQKNNLLPGPARQKQFGFCWAGRNGIGRGAVQPGFPSERARELLDRSMFGDINGKFFMESATGKTAPCLLC